LKLKLVALTLIAFACWLLPIKVLAQETDIYVTRSPQTIPEVHDQAGASTAQADPSERQEESKEKEVITPTNERPIPSNSEPTVVVPTSSLGDKKTERLSSGRNYSVEEVKALIIQYSQQYGISADLPLRIAKCESGYNQFSRNSHSTASGVFQFLNSTWANQPAGKRGVSVFDANANVQAAVWLLAHGKTSMWVCK
jgi:hypothetical protein